MKTLKNIPPLAYALLLLLGINYLASLSYGRYDLTQDNRYTLSDPAKEVLDKINSPLTIDVYLEGDFPSEFRKLQNETRYLLEEITTYNSNVTFGFSNPIPEGSDAGFISQQFAKFGMTPLPLKVKHNGKESSQTIFPWATANHNGKAIPISLTKSVMGASPEEFVYASTQNLEYSFIEGLSRLIKTERKSIAVLRDNGETSFLGLSDMLNKLEETYNIEAFPMDGAIENPEQALKALQNTFDLVLVAKPTKAFTDEQKFILDQYTINGGNSLWLLDMVSMENDSLLKNDGKAFALPRDLRLNDMFFKYGVRVNPVLVKDIYSAPLGLASGDGSDTRYTDLPWFYQPQVPSFNTHSINTNIELPIKFNYANSIELLKSAEHIKKTMLLTSSPFSKLVGAPRLISLDEIGIEPQEEDYTAGPQPLAVLLEGPFESAFKNRIQPVVLKELRFRESATKPAKMVIISDGDFIENGVSPSGKPLELGFDFWTRKHYGNKEFLLNTVNYLMDDTGLINIRTKEIALSFLDGQKTAKTINKWQALSIGLPLFLLLILGVLFYLLRKRRYAY